MSGFNTAHHIPTQIRVPKVVTSRSGILGARLGMDKVSTNRESVGEFKIKQKLPAH